MSKIESNVPALVLLNLLNSLQKRDKMLGKPCILSLFPNLFNKFNKTGSSIYSGSIYRNRLSYKRIMLQSDNIGK